MSDTKNLYEGLFLFPQSASGNLQAAADHINELFRRADAEVVSFAKWDERRLAYEIKGNKRGVYFMTYFKADPTRLAGLERDCNLSEELLRTMVLKADHITDEDIAAADGRDKLADEIKVRGEKSEKGRGGRETSRIVDAATREAEVKAKAEAEAKAKAEAKGEDAKADGDDAGEPKAEAAPAAAEAGAASE